MSDCFLNVGELQYDIKALLGKRYASDPADAAGALELVVRAVSDLDPWQHETLESAIRPLAEELGVKTGELVGVIRVAVTGQTRTPPLFETMGRPGRHRTLERLGSAIARLAQL